MAKTLLCEVVTPERVVYNNEVRMVVATTTQGEIGILPLHAPLVATLAPGEVRLQYGDTASEWEVFTIAGGYVQVHEDKVIVLADAAVAAGQIDVDRARESKENIEARLADLPVDAVDEREECIRDLNWCDTQIRSAEKHGHR